MTMKTTDKEGKGKKKHKKQLIDKIRKQFNLEHQQI